MYLNRWKKCYNQCFFRFDCFRVLRTRRTSYFNLDTSTFFDLYISTFSTSFNILNLFQHSQHLSTFSTSFNILTYKMASRNVQIVSADQVQMATQQLQQSEEVTSDRRLPERANRGVNNRDVVNRAEEIAREQLKNRYWLVHYEDNTCDASWSRHNSIVLDMVARTKIKKHDAVEVRFRHRNPRTDNFIWTANVLRVGGKDYIEKWKQDAWVQITSAEGDINFVPLLPLVDPDLTIYDDVSQLLLNGYGGGSQGVKKKLTMTAAAHPPSQYKSTKMQNEDPADFGNEESECPELDPNDVSRCLNAIPGDQSNCSSISNQGESLPRNELNNPQFSSTPGNKTKKVKRPRIVHPDEMADLEVKRADLEAAEAIKLAADKILEAAVLISNCVRELQPEIKSLANRNYREIQMSSNAMRQLTYSN
ncbi:uncharacterized protein LOC142337336 [Convolutriloba macropyga]|uniref:uncharacterized protein LOC142337336 n=1 Tax=Convolutriloba macropyga TaxID=536237 RepID=UPI003F51DA28